jgi:CheY-like chemotaxis protein
MLEMLVVDDEETVGRIFAQRLRKEIREGAIVLHFARNGYEALEVFERRLSALGLVLSDINMPGMSGLELLGRIRRQAPTVPVFMISAYEDDKSRHQALELGATGYLAKPMEFTELKRLLVQFGSGAHS